MLLHPDYFIQCNVHKIVDQINAHTQRYQVYYVIKAIETWLLWETTLWYCASNILWKNDMMAEREIDSGTKKAESFQVK